MRWLWMLVLFAGSGLGVASTDRVELPASLPIDALWQMPRNIAAQDLVNGPWGTSNAPGPNAMYELVRPKPGGSSPGLVVHDSQGRTWHVQQRRQASPEVVVPRILSAVRSSLRPALYLAP